MDSQPAASGGRWSWPEDISASTTGTDARSSPTSSAEAQTSHASQPDHDAPPPRRTRHYRPRTCRICLEVVQPTVEEDASGAAAFFRGSPRVKYVSADPNDGRLISPCRCKGSQKYVHEGCLQAWRKSQPLSGRHFWKCPTCHFEYRMERLRWGRLISSRSTRAALTLAVFALTVFSLGFVADPIINLWFDPLGTISDTITGPVDGVGHFDELDNEEPEGWANHFLKGFFSLGLLGFLKTMLAASPFYWFNIRIGGNRRRRNRLENVNWMLVIIGAFTFLGVSPPRLIRPCVTDLG